MPTATAPLEKYVLFRRRTSTDTRLVMRAGGPAQEGDGSAAIVEVAEEPVPLGPGDGLLSAALASVSNAVMITDAHGVIVWVNAGFTEMSGYTAEEAVGSTPRLLKSGVQDEAFYAGVWSTILAGRSWDGELINRHRSGRLYTVRQTITPIADGGGRPVHLVAVHEDVTELRAGQARLRALFDRGPDAVVFFDDDGRCVDANPAACELAGGDLDELRSVPVTELLPDHRWSDLWPALRRGLSRTADCRIRRRDDRLIEVVVEVVPDVMAGLHVAVIRDVTAQRHAEAERDFQAQLVEAAGAAIVATDLNGVVTFWNAAATRLYGWTAEEVLGRNIVETSITSKAAGMDRIMARVRARGRWSGEYEVPRRDGTTFAGLFTVALHVDASGEPAGFIATAADISELRNAQQDSQLRASQQAAVATLGRAALTDLDLDVLFDHAAGAVATELGLPMVSVLELTEPGDELLLRARFGPGRGLIGVGTIPNDRRSQGGYTLETGEAVTFTDLATETRFAITAQLTADGVVSGLSTAIRGTGDSYGVLSAHTTDRRTFTDDEVVFLDAIAAVLGAAIARDRIETQLQATVDQLTRSEQIRLAFLRATSHELRTPLSAVTGFTDTLRQHDRDLDPDQRATLLDRLQANTRRLTRLIEDLLDVDRLSTGLVTANREPHDVRALVHRVAKEQDPAGRHLQLDLDDVEADIDPAKLERVVANLLANAVRHTPPGSTIDIQLHTTPEAMVLTIDDDGDGIDPDYLDQIFDPFVQAPAQHHHPQPGTGLGLTLARDLTALHGGELTATNRTAGGIRMEVRIPHQAPPRHPETAEE